MLPLPPIENPYPDLSNVPDFDSIFGEVLSDTGAPAADVPYNLAALQSPIPGPHDITPLPSSLQHTPENQPNFQSNVPLGTSDFLPAIAQYPAVLLPVENQVPHDVRVDEHANGDRSEVLSLAEMLQLEHPDSPLPELHPISEFLENKASSEEKSDCTGQTIRKRENTGTHPRQDRVSPSLHISPSSKHLTQQVQPQYQGRPDTLAASNVAKNLPSVCRNCPRTQNILDASLTNMSSLSRCLHIRQSSEKSERPAKRQRKDERETSSPSNPALSRLFTVSSSQVDQALMQGRIRKGNESQRFSMPVVDDAAIQRNLMAHDIRYQWNSTTDGSFVERGALAIGNESAIHQGREPACVRLLQKTEPQAGIFQTSGNTSPVQPPCNRATNISAANNFVSGLPLYSTSLAEGIAAAPYPLNSRNLMNPMSLNEAENIVPEDPTPVFAASFSLRSDPKTANKSTANANNSEKPTVMAPPLAADYPIELEAFPNSSNLDATANAPSFLEISGLQHPEDPGKTSDSGDLQKSEGSVADVIEEEANEFDENRRTSEVYYNIIRMENLLKCDMCTGIYIGEERLDRHRKAVHGNDEVHTCLECQRTFKNSTNLRRHTDQTHRVRNFFCTSCNAGFSKKRSLVLHEKEQHGVVPKSVIRKKCGRQPSSSTNKKKGMYYECLLCMYSTFVKGNLMRHVRGTHLNERPFRCPYCDKRGKTKQNIDFHVQVCRKRPQDAFDER